MNPELQKKWFVYLSNHHEGPFSVQELSQKQKNGLINRQNYVWTEGMNDWIPMAEVPELIQDLKKYDDLKKHDLLAVSPSKEKKTSPPERKKGTLTKAFKVSLVTLVAILVSSVGGLALISRFGSEELHAFIRPTLNQFTIRVPFLGTFFSKVPKIQDLKPEIRKELEAVMNESPQKSPQLAFSVVQGNPSRPVIFLATNLPDQTRFDVYLLGKEDTLLNRLQYQSKFTVVSENGIGKSEALLADDGQPLSKGEYQIWIAESSDQAEGVREQLNLFPSSRPSGTLPEPVPNSAKFVSSKSVFLGGARDEAYLTKLKAFHEKIKENSEKELVELRQYADTLALQFETLNGEFEKILKAKKISPSQKENWKTIARQWTQINGQLEQTIQTWSKETLQNEFFYGSAFELVKSSYDSIKKLFTIENDFVENPSDRNLFLIQHGKALSESRQTLEQLRGKIESILNAPKTTVGLPKREEI